MLKQEAELEENPKPVVPAHVWEEIEAARRGKWVTVQWEPMDWELKLLNGYFRALEWLEYPVRVQMDEHVLLVLGGGLTWKEAGSMWANRSKSK